MWGLFKLHIISSPVRRRQRQSLFYMLDWEHEPMSTIVSPGAAGSHEGAVL